MSIKGQLQRKPRNIVSLVNHFGWDEILDPEVYELMDISTHEIKNKNSEDTYVSVVGLFRLHAILLLKQTEGKLHLISFYETGTVEDFEIIDVDKDGYEEFTMTIYPNGTGVEPYKLTLESAEGKLIPSSSKEEKITQLQFLKENLPEGYVSEDSEISLLDGITSSESPYRAVLVYQVTGTGHRGTKRLAVFSKENKFMGVYSGISEAPILISAKGIHFSFDEMWGNIIPFEEAGLKKEVHLGGEFFDLEN